jgi:hypothetical protein
MKPESAKEKAEQVLLPLLTLMLGFVISPFLREMWDYAADIVLPKLSPRARLSILATMTITCLVLGIWVYSLVSKRRLIKQFSEDEEFDGVYRHNNSRERVCGPCLHGDGKAIPIFGDGGSFKCSKCPAEFLKPVSAADAVGGASSRNPLLIQHQP